jgi:hypothetical protein
LVPLEKDGPDEEGWRPPIRKRHQTNNMMVLVSGKERTRKQWEAIYEAAGLRIQNVTSIQDNICTRIIEGVKR